ncbi:hypothetical protein AHAS_Ahas06G0165000 [Arachis hypogaea]
MRWQTRSYVALDVAKGLQCLHSCDPPVIHSNIKPSNVLLERSFAAKIGDFGLARFKTENRLEAEALSYESDGASAFEEQSLEGPIPSPDAVVKKNGKGVGGNLANEENGGSSGAVLKDYVMDWIGNDFGIQRPKVELTASAASTNAKDENNNNKKHKSNSSSSRRKLEWWKSMEKQRKRLVREWWKEEYSQELA